MLFTTPTFIFLFLPIFLIVYYSVPEGGHWRNYVALVGSLLFFSWAEPVYVFFLLGSVYVDYRISNLISSNSKLSATSKKNLLRVGVFMNVVVLVGFKYTTFILNEILVPLGVHVGHSEGNQLPLLVGISFITFHKISYLVDSYKGRAVPPRNFFDCALYIFLFPQLIAGPIIRYHDIGEQIHHRAHISSSFLLGLFRFSIGFSKKVLIADPLGLVADRVFGLPAHELYALYAWGGAFAYMLQIYFDFSGYSDMAIGLGRMMGFRFPENFNRPYSSRSITEFWRRWHISLSSWMRLYVYIPLGGSRVSRTRSFLNLWIVFLISGLWHGANWTFLVWGGYYGMFLCIEKYASEVMPTIKDYIPSFVRLFLTMLVVIFGWVIFRAETLTYALDFTKAMLGISGPDINIHPWGLLFGNRDLFLLCIGAVIVFYSPRQKTLRPPVWVSSVWSDAMTINGSAIQLSMLYAATVVLFLVSVMAMLSAEYTPFLYFRF